MKEEAISSSHDPQLPPKASSPPPTHTPAASSVGASSPAVPTNAGGTDRFVQPQGSKAAALSRIGSQPMWTSMSTSAGGSALGSSQPSCRPWERGDLLRRLSTFRPTNWFGKPKASSSLTCARRGWVNVDADTIECEACGANLRFVSSATWTPDEADIAGEEFAKKLDEGHKATCPWRGNTCAESLVQFPPTPPSALIGGYKDRCDGLLQFPSLPIVAASAIEHIRISRSSEIDRLLAQSQAFGGMEPIFRSEIMSGTETNIEDVFLVYSHAHKLISLCGWEPRWLPNIQDCEEHSAQSARSGYSIGPTKYHTSLQDFGHGENVLPASKKKNSSKNKAVGTRSTKGESRSPLLDCSLCGATVRIWDFLTVVRPACFAPNTNDIPETSKKMALTRGVSAASGISGWVAADGMGKEQTEDLDEAATTEEGRSLSNIGVDLNLTMAGGLSSSQVNMDVRPEQFQDVRKRRHPIIGQPSSSEVGGHAASYESRGPSSRKRNLEEGGSTVDRPQLPVQPADSVEGTVIDRDGDEVNDGSQYSAGPSKRTCQSDAFGPQLTSYGKDSSGAGPSLSLGFEIGRDASRDDTFGRGQEQLTGMPSTRDSTHVSSVIAMDTVHSADDDSMESVENLPGDFDDVNFPSTSMLRSADPVETSELNYSNQAQQSTCPAVVRSAGEMGVSSTNDEEVVNADTATGNVRDGPSVGISGGSIGMGASHEAEIHGTDASVHRADSVAGDVEAVAEITENQGQTGEFAPDPGLMGDYVPEEVDRVDPNGDSQDLTSRSVGRADSGSKIVGSAKAESIESGERTRHMQPTLPNSPHPSLSCNAVVYSAYEASKDEVTQNNAPATDDCGFFESGYMLANGTGPPIGESNYDEAVEFDPIKHHNFFCPWVNGNVAAAGCSSSGSSSSNAGAIALCGWQLTLDALDSFQSLGHVPVQTVESESAASLYKDDHRATGRKLLARHSFSKRHGQN
ncbi:PREDICTED: uncharacterized protein LOC109228800 isoform X1 [Nicotiana attenuata]|uniref:Uncharacterized protein n=1 Tax=Nicotiana attenuata TaxID=49451 RepID=A0A1J6IYT3_NICAT|nr:PREDICTED: uncharacterized protein LOC109228800 isoform X1 [Nicotiana attenuata]OIT00265.1 hypothetical protein A4A49_22439 [Nicotiana attenuata]